MGLAFDVVVSGVDESVGVHDGPEDFALQVARRKALAVAGVVGDALVIGGDTVVTLDGRIFGKPTDVTDATEMLGALSGRAHQVISALAVVDTTTGEARAAAATSTVRMRALGEDEIAAYVATGEPFDKAGAYAIQGLGGRLVAGHDGDLDTVIGLSTRLLRELLATFDVEVPAVVR
jgi:septum formation protein